MVIKRFLGNVFNPALNSIVKIIYCIFLNSFPWGQDPPVAPSLVNLSSGTTGKLYGRLNISYKWAVLHPML